MHIWILLLVGVVQISAVNSTNAESCTTDAPGNVAVCVTEHPTRTVSTLGPNTTHLLLTLSDNVTRHQSFNTYLDFSHLVNLEVLLLDFKGVYSNTRVHLHQASFPEGSEIRVFHSRMRLDITTDVFSRLTMLESLTLTNTAVTWELVPQLMNESLCNLNHLQYLDLTRFSAESSAFQLGFRPREVFAGCRIPSLKFLSLRDNDIEKAHSGWHIPFQNLVVLDLSYNAFTKTAFFNHDGQIYLLELICFLPLHTLDVGNQLTKPDAKPPLEEKDLLSSFEYPQISTHFNLSNNERILLMIESERILIYGQNKTAIVRLASDLSITLEKFVAANLIGSQKDDATFENFHSVEYDFPLPLNLRYIDFSNNAFLLWKRMFVDGKLFVESVRFVNLQRNDIPSVLPKFFRDISDLETLLLGYNSLGLEESLTTLNVRENKYLKVLDLAHNRITEIPRELLVGASALQQVNLTGNHIRNFSMDLQTLVNLELLNLTNNMIKIFTPSVRGMFDDLVKNRTLPLTIDLSGNTLSCACVDIPFIEWLRSTEVTILKQDLLTCRDSFNGIYTLDTVDLKDFRGRCYPNTTQMIILSVALTFVITLALSAVIVVYCKRWRLRYWWYITNKAWKQYTTLADMTQYDYDAFVAYDYNDFSWVKRELLAEMEQKKGFKLCVHHRDFPIGDNLNEIIVDCIHKSRKTILLLTPEFVKSHWCEFEFNMARNRLFDSGQDVIIAVILKTLPSGCVSGSLYQVLKKNLYLEWVDDDDTARSLFWRKLCDALES